MATNQEYATINGAIAPYHVTNMEPIDTTVPAIRGSFLEDLRGDFTRAAAQVRFNARPTICDVRVSENGDAENFNEDELSMAYALEPDQIPFIEEIEVVSAGSNNGRYIREVWERLTAAGMLASVRAQPPTLVQASVLPRDMHEHAEMHGYTNYANNHKCRDIAYICGADTRDKTVMLWKDCVFAGIVRLDDLKQPAVKSTNKR